MGKLIEVKPQLKVVKNQPCVDSVNVSEMVDVPHRNVLTTIRTLIEDLNKVNKPTEQGTLLSEPQFLLSEYTDPTGRKLPMYIMNEMGLSVLMMRFRSQKALEAQIRYAKEFIRMREALQRQQMPEWKTARLEGKAARREETDVIQLFIEYAKDKGSTSADKYYINVTKMLMKALGLEGTPRDMMTTKQLMDLRDGEQVAADAFLEAMDQDLAYKEGYQFAKAAVLKFVAGRTVSRDRYLRLQAQYGKRKEKELTA